MAGFMAGFSGALTEGIKANKARKDQREDDVFKMSYQSYLTNKDKMMEYKEKDKQAAANAEVLAAGTDNPEESYKAIYSALKSGVSFDYLSESLKENKIKVLETPSVDKPEQVAKPSVDAQMSEAMPVSKPSGGNWVAEMFSPNGNVDQYRQKAIQDIAAATGEDVANVSKAITGNYREESDTVKFLFEKKTTTPEKLEKLEDIVFRRDEAKRNGDTASAEKYDRQIAAINTTMTMEARAKAKERGSDNFKNFITTDEKGVYAGPMMIDATELQNNGQVFDVITGQPVDPQNLRPMPDGFDQAYLNLAKDNLKLSEDYDERTRNWIEASSISNKMIRIAREQPAVINYGGSLTESARGVLANVGGVMDRLKGEFYRDDKSGPLSSEQYANVIEQLDGQTKNLVDILSDEGKDIAEKHSAYTAMLDILAFKAAAMEKQVGRDVTEKDFERFRNVVGSGSSPESVEEKLNQFLMEKLGSIETQRRQLAENGAVKAFENQYKVKTGFLPTGIEELIASSGLNRDAQERYDVITAVASKPYVPAGTKEGVQTEAPQNLRPADPVTMENAKKAIAKNPAIRDKVRQRMIENRMDPGDL